MSPMRPKHSQDNGSKRNNKINLLLFALDETLKRGYSKFKLRRGLKHVSKFPVEFPVAFPWQCLEYLQFLLEFLEHSIDFCFLLFLFLFKDKSIIFFSLYNLRKVVHTNLPKLCCLYLVNHSLSVKSKNKDVKNFSFLLISMHDLLDS